MYRNRGDPFATAVPPDRAHAFGVATLSSEAIVKLQEFHAKTLLSRAGLPVPPYSVASTPAEAREQADGLLR